MAWCLDGTCRYGQHSVVLISKNQGLSIESGEICSLEYGGQSPRLKDGDTARASIRQSLKRNAVAPYADKAGYVCRRPSLER